MQWDKRWLDRFAQDVATWLTAAKACQREGSIEMAADGSVAANRAFAVSDEILLTLDERDAQYERFNTFRKQAKLLVSHFDANFTMARRADGMVEVQQKGSLTIKHVEHHTGVTNKLTEVQRQELMEMVKAGEPFSQIAQAYGVTTSTVGYYADKIKKLNGSADK